MREDTCICQNCKSKFVIKPEDFAFYEKIKVPPPTWCSECRMVRRFLFRNERTFYKQSCGLCGKETITIFAPGTKRNVFCPPCWWSDKWDPMRYGKEVDLSKTFFGQLRELWEEVPVPAVFTENCVNSPYANHTHDSKNCYLIFGASFVENTAYGARLINVRDSFDVTAGGELEQCYDDISCYSAQKLFFSVRSEESYNAYFLKDCRNVNNSLGCVNLRNKQYHIFNRSYTKEEYEKKILAYNLESRASLGKFREEFEAFSLRFPRKFAHITNSESVVGDNVINSKRCHVCFNSYGNLEDCAYTINAADMRDGYDGYGVGAGAELLYEGVDSGVQAGNMAFTLFVHGCHNVRYCFNCHGSSHLFGSVGVRSGTHIILNRQYTKEEYEATVKKIIEKMSTHPYIDSAGRKFGYGEFFPLEFSSFSYNESAAQEYFPLTKSAALQKGYRWRDIGERNYSLDRLTEDISDRIADATNSISKETIECLHRGACNDGCTKGFRLIPDEFAFYQKMNLPIPDLCPNCRHYRRLSHQNQYRLWHRTCQCAGPHSENGVYKNQARHSHAPFSCAAEFETTYALDQPEIVYCEQCYQAEIL